MNKFLCLVLSVTMVFCSAVSVFASNEPKTDTVVNLVPIEKRIDRDATEYWDGTPDKYVIFVGDSNIKKETVRVTNKSNADIKIRFADGDNNQTIDYTIEDGKYKDFKVDTTMSKYKFFAQLSSGEAGYITINMKTQ